jgi:hypothetical protein
MFKYVIGQWSAARRLLGACLAAAVFALGVGAPTPHTAVTAQPLPLWADKADVQVLASTLEVQLRPVISPAPTDNWTIKLAFGPADSEQFSMARAEHEVVTVSGSGATVPPIAIGPEWRWYLLPLPLVGLRVYTTVAAGGTPASTMQEVELVARVGSRQYDPTAPRNKFGGGWRGFPSGAALMVPPPPDYEALGSLVREATSPATFVAGAGLRVHPSVPFMVPPRDATSVAADVVYVPPAGPETVVYHGTSRIRSALARGSRVDVPTRLTPAGIRLAGRLGVRSLARSLASSGYIFFTSTGGLAHGGDTAPEMIEVPMGSCYRNVTAAPKHPCRQTCPRCSEVQAPGYMIYTAIGDVYGSSTCRRGAPLVPWPMY